MKRWSWYDERFCGVSCFKCLGSFYHSAQSIELTVTLNLFPTLQYELLWQCVLRHLHIALFNRLVSLMSGSPTFPNQPIKPIKHVEIRAHTHKHTPVLPHNIKRRSIDCFGGMG